MRYSYGMNIQSVSMMPWYHNGLALPYPFF